MKTNVLMKFGVVAIAAFGAFAFNGNANAQQEFTRSDTCESITAECSVSGIETCRIEVLPDVYANVHDLECSMEVKHDDSDPVNWQPRNN